MTEHDVPARPPRPHPDDRARPPRRRGHRHRRHDGQGRRSRAGAWCSSPAPAARWARSSSRSWTRPRTTGAWARSARPSWRRRWPPLGVTEWENLGYHDSDMMGRPGNRDPRTFWQANLDEAIGRLVWMVRRYRPDVMTTYNDFGGYGHPDHIRTHLVAVGAFARAGDPAWYPEQLAPEHGGSGALPRARAASRRGRRPSSTSRRSRRRCARRSRSGWRPIGERSFWCPPEDATPEQLAEFEAFAARMLVPTRRSRPGWTCRRSWTSAGRRSAPTSPRSRREPVRARSAARPGAEFWSREAFVRRETRVPAPDHEDGPVRRPRGRRPGRTAGADPVTGRARTRACRPRPSGSDRSPGQGRARSPLVLFRPRSGSPGASALPDAVQAIVHHLG